MSLDPESVPRQNIGALQSCLLEGDPEQRRLEHRVRRRAFFISISLQILALALVVLIPLFAKPPHLLAVVLPPAPYYSMGEPKPAPHQPHPRIQNVCRFCAPLRIPQVIATTDNVTPSEQMIDSPVLGTGPTIPGQIPLPFLGPAPSVRPPLTPPTERSHLHRVTHIDPAMLIHRVEPVYPTLARHLGRAGRIELHAVIATDGTIQSLQVVSGDPLFYQSALEAVRQWRYRPTVLNGEPVEIDTFITVIYHIDR